MAETKKGSVPTFNSCLCCVSLSLGSLIIGWYYAISGTLSLIFLYSKSSKFIDGLSTNGAPGPAIANLLNLESLVLLQMLVCASIYLIFGVRRRRPDYVQGFVVIGTLVVFYDTFVILLLLFTPIGKDMAKVYEPTFGKEVSESMYHPVSKIVDAAIFLYLLLVVNSYYRDLKKTSQHSPGAVV